jgi:hypothetical protein
VAVIISGSWVAGGAVVSICEGDAICYVLFFAAHVVLIIRFWPAMAGNFYHVANMIVSLDHFSSKKSAPQGLVLLYRFLPFNLQGTQMSFKVEDQVELYRGKLG